MNCILTRNKADSTGVWGVLKDENGAFLAYTLEHAYADGAAFTPKVAPGTYTCILGTYRLEGAAHSIQAYCLQDVPDFQGAPVTDILLHIGNYNRDSEGCILLGQAISDSFPMLLNSGKAWEAFMALQASETSFILVVQ